MDLSTKESRREWEQQFYTLCIQPKLNDIDAKLNAALNLFINDDMQGIQFYHCPQLFVYILLVSLLAHNALLQVVYEKNTEKSSVAAMWRYRSRITIEHLEFFIGQQKSAANCPILKQYLKEVMTIKFFIMVI